MPTPIKYPAVLMVRGGSKRLPNKWALPWLGRPLLTHALLQMLNCPSLCSVTLATDSEAAIEAALRESRNDGSFAGKQFGIVVRPAVPDDQTSLAGLAWVRSELGLQASHIMLCQCTSPYINSFDLKMLAETYNPREYGSAELCRPGDCKPTGMAYMFPPGFTDADRGKVFAQVVWQAAPAFDIDTMDDYRAAVQALPQYDLFSAGVAGDLPKPRASLSSLPASRTIENGGFHDT